MDLPEIPKHRPQMESLSFSTESADSLSIDSPVPHLPSHRPHKHATGVTENENLKSNMSSPQIPFSRPQRSKSSEINETPVVPKRRPVVKDNENDTSDSTESIPIVPSKRPSVHKPELSSASILPNDEPSIAFTELKPSTGPIESNLPTSELDIPTTSPSVSSNPSIPSSRPQKATDISCGPSVPSREQAGTPGSEGIELNSAKGGVNQPIKMQLEDNENSAEIKECEDNDLITKKGNENLVKKKLPAVNKDESEFLISTTRHSKSESKIEEDINSVEKEGELESKALEVPTEEISSKIENNIEEKKGGMAPDESQIENVSAKEVMSANDIKNNMGSMTGKNEDLAFHLESSFPTIPLARPKKPASEPITEKDVDYVNKPGHTAALTSVLPNSRPKLVNDVESGPKIPLKRPSLKQNESEDSVTSGSEKKLVPKVPKKPSSKIAQFQMMLEQQQKQDLGLMNKPKHKPKPPVKRPTTSEKDINEEIKDADIPEPEEEEEEEVAAVSPKVGKLSSRFTQNLNGMIGMALPGMGMAFGGSPVASMQAATLDNEIQDQGVIHEVKHVKDVRRARARGPRGRKLPDAVKKTVEINDETLGNKFTIFVGDLWSFDFKRSAITEAEEEREPSAEFSVETKECKENISDEKDSETSEIDQNDFMTATEGIVEPEPSVENVFETEENADSDSTHKVVTESLDPNLGSLGLSSKEESLEPLEEQSVLGSPVTGSSVLSSSEDGIVEDGDHTSSGVLSM